MLAALRRSSAPESIGFVRHQRRGGSSGNADHPAPHRSLDDCDCFDNQRQGTARLLILQQTMARSSLTLTLTLTLTPSRLAAGRPHELLSLKRRFCRNVFSNSGTFWPPPADIFHTRIQAQCPHHSARQWCLLRYALSGKNPDHARAQASVLVTLSSVVGTAGFRS